MVQLLFYIAGNRVLFSAGDVINGEVKRRNGATENSLISIYVNVGDTLSGEGTYSQSGIPMLFTSSGIDLYLFSLLGLRVGPVQMSMKGLFPPIGLTHTSETVHDRVTSSRNIISMLGEGQQVSIVYIYGVTAPYHNAWGGFSVSGYMDPVVAFNVARSTSMSSLGLITYDTEIVNTGQFNLTSSTFIAPLDGIYYFSVSTGLQPHISVELMLKVNGIDMYIIFRRSSHHKGVETISGTTLLDLQAGDLVSLHLTKGQIHSSIEQHEMSFVGFLYSPRFVARVAWVVSVTTSTTCRSVFCLIFDKVDVVKGVNINSFGNIEVPVSGIYYLYYSAFASVGKPTHMSLKLNGKELILLALSTYHPRLNGLVAASGSFIYPFKSGDILSVNPMFFHMAIMGDMNRSTSFMGFLIKETK